MTIAFLTPEYPHPNTGSSGGIGTSIRNLAIGLLAEGCSVRILVYGQKGEGIFDDNGVLVQRIRNVKFKGLSWYLTRKKLEKIINKLYAENAIDLVEAPDWTGITSFIQPKKCPIIIRLNGSDTYFCHLDKRPVKWFNKYNESRALKKADGLLSVSQFTADLTNTIFGLKKEFTIIPNGIDTSLFILSPTLSKGEGASCLMDNEGIADCDKNSKVEEIHAIQHKIKPFFEEELPITPNNYWEGKKEEVDNLCIPASCSFGEGRGEVILYFGSLIRKKGLLELPLIFNEVIKKHPEAKLILVGRDVPDIISGKPSTWEMMQELFTAEAMSSVSYLGSVSYRDVKKHIDEAILCVFPTFAEALPVSWLEAMAMEKPIVASNIGWATEVIDDGINGFLVHPNAHVEYAHKIVELLDSANLQKKFGAAAREKVTQKFSIERVAQQSLSFYNSLITSK